jgi:pyruvate/2-oxoglutarate dehydrogenase complex dihydrolipoamide dehydrogenase (E3) component
MENPPNIKSLNLEGVKVKLTAQKIKVNQKLQMTNTKVYACSNTIGGYKPSDIVKYEASITLKHTLFVS